MNRLVWLLLGSAGIFASRADDFRITSFSRDGTLAVTNAFTNGVVTLATAAAPGGPWVPAQQVFSTSRVAQMGLTLGGPGAFYRAQALDLSGPGAREFVFKDILDLSSFGTLLIMDKDNGLIRKVDTNGLCTLVVDNGAFILQGRGLWIGSPTPATAPGSSTPPPRRSAPSVKLPLTIKETSSSPKTTPAMCAESPFCPPHCNKA